jgi:quercetin 2,3-dioxygenase
MQIISARDIDIDGFAGLRERHYVMDSRMFGDHRKTDAVDGLGAFVYLADAHFLRYGSTGRHSHRDIDIVTLVMGGRLLHRGTLGDESLYEAGDVLIQRAGVQGFEHNEVNPDERPNRIVQIWMQPQQSQGAAQHGQADWPQHGRKCVYRSGDTCLDLVTLAKAESLAQSGEYRLYLVSGAGVLTEAGGAEQVSAEALVSGENLQFQASAATQAALVYRSVS